MFAVLRKIILLSALFITDPALRAAVPAYELAGVFTGALGVGASEIYKADIVAADPRWKTPPAVDVDIRDAAKWSNTRLAGSLSDVMVWGIIAPAAFLSPLALKSSYGRAALTIAEAAVATGVVTQIAKFSFARARPFAYYANDYSNPDSPMSFFSGHTSYSFALSISSAMLLADAYPKYRLLIYTVAFFVASIPGYLRIAADKHYFTDVFAGAVVGSSLAYGVVRLQMTGTTSQYGGERQLQLQRVFVLQ